LLPCLVIASANLFAFLISAIFLPETKGFAPLSSPKTETGCGVEGAGDETVAGGNPEDEALIPDLKSDDIENGERRRKRYHSYGTNPRSGQSHPSQVSAQARFMPYDSFPPVYIVHKESRHSSSLIEGVNNNNSKYNRNFITAKNNNDNTDDLPTIDEDKELASHLAKPRSYEEQSLCGRGPLTVMLLYGVYSFVAVAADEIAPVWTATNTRYGGLNFTTSQTGLMTGSPAVFVALLCLYLAPVIISQLGIRRTCIIGLLTFGIALPALTLGEFMGSSIVPYMCFSWTFVKLGGGLTFLTLACVCCSCVSRSRNGAMNGAATSISYLARILGPYLAGYLYTLTTTPLPDGSRRSFPFDFHLAFFFLDAGVIVCMILAFFLLKIFDSD